MIYRIMNKDNEVASFSINRDDTFGEIVFTMVEQVPNMVPIGFKNPESWINGRKASKHNTYLKRIMMTYGCEDTEEFIRITHAATLNDTFWVKSEHENITWNDVSLYRNEYNELISKLAFEGSKLYGIKISSVSPELSTAGRFRKCWVREGDGIFLYKRGQESVRNVGLEPYCEQMASELAQKICPGAVPYNLVKLHGELASKCKLFTNEKYGYVPYAKLQAGNSVRDILQYYEKLGSEDAFRRMIVLDSIIFNVDRHAGNHGILIDNDTLQPLAMAPVFDLNLSLLPYVEKDEFSHIGDKMLEYGPRIGEYFTRTGQRFLTSGIRKDLINLKDFEFSFRGDEKFDPERVKIIEKIVNKQINAILSKELLYTKDVFVPDLQLFIDHKTDKEKQIEQQIISNQEIKAEELWQRLEKHSVFESHLIEMEENRINLVVFPRRPDCSEIHISMDDKKITMEIHGIEKSLSDCVMHYPQLLDSYKIVMTELNEKEKARDIKHDHTR